MGNSSNLEIMENSTFKNKYLLDTGNQQRQISESKLKSHNIKEDDFKYINSRLKQNFIKNRIDISKFYRKKYGNDTMNGYFMHLKDPSELIIPTILKSKIKYSKQRTNKNNQNKYGNTVLLKEYIKDYSFEEKKGESSELKVKMPIKLQQMKEQNLKVYIPKDCRVFHNKRLNQLMKNYDHVLSDLIFKMNEDRKKFDTTKNFRKNVSVESTDVHSRMHSFLFNRSHGNNITNKGHELIADELWKKLKLLSIPKSYINHRLFDIIKNRSKLIFKIDDFINQYNRSEKKPKK